MKKILLILSLMLFTSISLAQTPQNEYIQNENIQSSCGLDNNSNYSETLSQETILKDWENPNLYKYHQLVLTKYKINNDGTLNDKEKSVLEKTTIHGTSASFSNTVEQPYNTITNDSNNKAATKNTFTTGQFVTITKNPKNDNQCLIISSETLVSQDNFIYNDQTIQLPEILSKKSINHLTDNMKIVLQKTNDTAYILEYTGKKI